MSAARISVRIISRGRFFLHQGNKSRGGAVLPASTLLLILGFHFQCARIQAAGKYICKPSFNRSMVFRVGDCTLGLRVRLMPGSDTRVTRRDTGPQANFRPTIPGALDGSHGTAAFRLKSEGIGDRMGCRRVEHQAPVIPRPPRNSDTTPDPESDTQVDVRVARVPAEGDTAVPKFILGSSSEEKTSLEWLLSYAWVIGIACAAQAHSSNKYFREACGSRSAFEG
ncbi:hypothetical protein C8R43DRAFT_946232 [Mycena crocata]|nr:hypothetical protein C8R43DRAFT_946232 [Mycena crocata]